MEKRVLKRIGLIIFFYSLLFFSGGVMGFAMKQSLPSLFMGGLFGLALLFLSIKIMTFHRYGLIGATVLTLLLDAFFSYRFLITKAFFPAGAMLLLTTAVLVSIMVYLKKLTRVAKGHK